jgi:uncharacterized protein YydD (DUF2326 family)
MSSAMLRLRKLYTDSGAIDPVLFRDGINIILGERDVTSAKTNGVGKSLCVEFINFALLKSKAQSRVSKIPRSAFDPDVEICLDVEIHDQAYTIRRSLADSERPTIISDGIIHRFDKLDDATRFFTEKIFVATDGVVTPSFRKVMGPLIRDERSEFKSIIACYDTKQRIADDFEPHLFFFGIDIEHYKLVREAIGRHEEILKEQARIKQNLNTLNKITIKDAKSTLNELDSEVKRIEQSLEDLEAFAGFETIKEEVLELESQIEQLRVERDLARRELRQLRLVARPVTIDLAEVTEFYRQIEGRLGDIVKRDLEEVISFKKTIDDFQNMLLRERAGALSDAIAAINNKLSAIEVRYRRFLGILDQGGNLRSLRQTYAAYKERSDELAQLRTFVTRYEDLERSKRYARRDKEARLLSLQSLIAGAKGRIERFQAFVLRMHEFIQGNRKASFDIEVTSAKQVVEFVMRIDDDGSHSVEREKVFIYDVSLLMSDATRGRHPGLLLHDNIFGVDDDTLRKSLQFLYQEGEFPANQQYIITFNEDQLEHVTAGSALAEQVLADVRVKYTKANRFLKAQYQELA